MNSHTSFFICPTCFNASESAATCHDHGMIKYDACWTTGEQRKPAVDRHGQFKSRAPQWFVEAAKGRPAMTEVFA